jgi:hypothetical protein
MRDEYRKRKNHQAKVAPRFVIHCPPHNRQKSNAIFSFLVRAIKRAEP